MLAVYYWLAAVAVAQHLLASSQYAVDDIVDRHRLDLTGGTRRSVLPSRPLWCALFLTVAYVYRTPRRPHGRQSQDTGHEMNFVPPPDGDDFRKDATCPWLCTPVPDVDKLLSDPAGVAALRRELRPGRCVALHGAPGSGKYTAAVAAARAAGMTVTTVWAQAAGATETAGYAAHTLALAQKRCLIVIGACSTELQDACRCARGLGTVVAILDDPESAAARRLKRQFDATVVFGPARDRAVVRAIARALCESGRETDPHWSMEVMSEIATDAQGDFRRALLHAYMHSLAVCNSQRLLDTDRVPPPTGPVNAARRVLAPVDAVDRRNDAPGELLLADRVLHTAAVAHSLASSRSAATGARLRAVIALSDDDACGYHAETAHALGLAARRARVRPAGFPTRAAFGFAPVKTVDKLGYGR